MANRILDISNINHIKLTNDAVKISDGEVVNFCLALKDKYEKERLLLDQVWKDSWAAYLTTPEARQYASNRAIDVIGDIDVNWRHSLVTAKAFETVETIVSYLHSSFFPNPRWFDLEPKTPIRNEAWERIVDINRRYVDLKLHQHKFKSVFRQFLRELCITGTAAIAMPWRNEVSEKLENTIQYTSTGDPLVVERRTAKIKSAPDLQVLSVFDFFLDPEVHNPNESNVIRRFSLTKGELIRLVESGKYPEANLKEIREDSQFSTDISSTAIDELNLMVGINIDQAPDGTTGNTLSSNTFSSNKLDVFEFWGDITVKNVEFKDVYIVWSGRHLLDFRQNPYWSGKPFQFGTYVDIVNTPYGIGCLQPVLPNLYQQNILMSRRADNISVSSDAMFTVLADGVVNMDEVYTAPGHKIAVTTHDAVRPLPLTTDQSVSLSEEGVLEQRIDKATGTGPFIGVGAGRSAERVTAEEIQAQRDAGGNRLNGVYSHIEETSMVPFLERYHELCRQFILEPEIVRVPVGNAAYAEYVLVGAELLQWPMAVRALGAGHIADKEFQLRQLLDWVNIVSGIEALQQKINWNGVGDAITQRMVPDIADQVLISAEEQMARIQDRQNLLAQQQEMLAVDPVQQVRDQAQFVGGQPAVSALDESLAEGGEGDLAAISQALGIN